MGPIHSTRKFLQIFLDVNKMKKKKLRKYMERMWKKKTNMERKYKNYQIKKPHWNNVKKKKEQWKRKEVQFKPLCPTALPIHQTKKEKKNWIKKNVKKETCERK